MDLALDPQFDTNGYIYIVYSRNGATGPKSTDAVNTYRISRFTVSYLRPPPNPVRPHFNIHCELFTPLYFALPSMS